MLDYIKEIRFPTWQEVEQLLQITKARGRREGIMVEDNGLRQLVEVRRGSERISGVYTCRDGDHLYPITHFYPVFIVDDTFVDEFAVGGEYPIVGVYLNRGIATFQEPQGDNDVVAVCIREGVLISKMPAIRGISWETALLLCMSLKSYKLALCPCCGVVHNTSYERTSEAGASIIYCANCGGKFTACKSSYIGLFRYITPMEVLLPEQGSLGLTVYMQNNQQATTVIAGKPVSIPLKHEPSARFEQCSPFADLETVCTKLYGEGWDKVCEDKLLDSIENTRRTGMWPRVTDEDVATFMNSLVHGC